ncbi:MAG: TonB-dependent receptor [Proteobacteria bacterium]|nr:TonB-dependent receptor [Pseudomonadota bacterium]
MTILNFSLWRIGVALSLPLLSAGPLAEAVAQTVDANAETPSLNTVIVSARKRDEPLASVPESITAFSSASLAAFDIQSFNDYASMTPNLSFTYGAGSTGISNARTVAIRGITGQSLFGTSGATGFYVDDTPLPESVDPRVLDLERVEVLKGPQGTLFGESSLGGNVRLITKAPDLTRNDVGYMAQVGITSGGGSADGGGGLVGNLVAIPDRLAVRMVLFVDHEAGYLTRTFPSPSSPAVADPDYPAPRTSVGDQGAQTNYGGSITALLRMSDALDIKLRVMAQDTHDKGFPATFAPLPNFEPHYTINRAYNLQPGATDAWALPSLDIRYRGNGFSIVSATGYFYHHNRDIEDSTYGTKQILHGYYGVASLPNQPFLWEQEHYQNQVTEEIRATFDEYRGVSGTIGAFYARTRSTLSVPPEYAQGLVAATVDNTVVGPWPNNLLWTDYNPGMQRDVSLFGEISWRLPLGLTATFGARQYWLHQTADFVANGFNNFGETPSDPQSSHQSGFNPKVGLAYQVSPSTMVYASASEGFRAGAAQNYAPFCALPTLPVDAITHLKSDSLWSYEVGTKSQIPNTGALLSAAAFHIDWRNLQQQVALPCGAYFDINGGHAKIDGAEIELDGHVLPALELRAGAGYEKTDITDPGALAIVGLTRGSRVLGTPAWTATLGSVFTQPISTDLEGFIAADVSYTGDSIALLNGGNGLFATRPSYVLANARLGVRRGASEISLNIRNLSNAKPNLGDIGYVGYAQYTSNNTIIPQVATLPPLTVLLQYRHNF